MRTRTTLATAAVIAALAWPGAAPLRCLTDACTPRVRPMLSNAITQGRA